LFPNTLFSPTARGTRLGTSEFVKVNEASVSLGG
jgi:hypothetical protein